MRRDLEAAESVDAWLLGHIHVPSHEALAGPRPIGYLGSVCGLDPSETGVHGPWRLTLEGGRALRLEQLALAPLAWLELDVPVDALQDPEALDGLLVAALRGLAEREGQRLGAARAVGCRLRLVGRSSVHRALRRRVAALAAGEGLQELRPRFDGRLYFVDKLVDDARPALALDELARSSDPPGLLARRLLALERGDPEGEPLVREARRRMESMVERRPWMAAQLEAPDEAAVRAHLLRAGEQALEELLAQREARR
jgi:hypothetical protein